MSRNDMQTPPAGHEAILLQEKELALAAKKQNAETAPRGHVAVPDTEATQHVPVEEEDILAQIKTPAGAQILRSGKTNRHRPHTPPKPPILGANIVRKKTPFL